MITRLAHLCLKTTRYERLVGFYRDTLGLAVKFTFTDQDGVDFGCYLDLGSLTFLEIFDQTGADRQWGGGTSPLRPNTNTFYQHFCLQVDGLEAYRATLAARGVAVTDEKMGVDGSRQCWICDPDGNRIELMEYTPASLQTRAGHGAQARAS